eukprot:6194554-Pleurochrysis_carterae.AAC.1
MSARAGRAQQRRLESAMESAFTYQLPPEARAAREAAARSRARQREFDIIESRIEEAMVDGAFDNLPGERSAHALSRAGMAHVCSGLSDSGQTSD